MLNWPNRLTLFRILLVPAIVMAIVYRRTDIFISQHAPLVIFSIAVITDACDGFIARRFNLRTRLGAFLDPLADKVLILSTLICFQVTHSYGMQIPSWVLILIVSRDLLIVGWLVVSYMNHIAITIRPNMLGKITTVFQMGSMIVMMLERPIAYYVWYITGVLTICSAASYIVREIRKLPLKLQHTGN